MRYSRRRWSVVVPLQEGPLQTQERSPPANRSGRRNMATAKKAAKKTAAKKPAAKKTAAKKPAAAKKSAAKKPAAPKKAAVKRKPNAAFMKAMQPSSVLAAV